MSSPKVDCDVCVLGDRNVIPQEDVSGAARIRKSKKPEIQIYRPGALRQKRSSVSNEHLISVTHEENTTKPVSTKKDVKDNGKKSLVQGRQGLLQEQKIMKEDRAIDSATKHKETVNKYIKKGRESHVEVNVDSSKKIGNDTQYCEEMHASECHAKEKEKSGFGTSKEQVKLSNAAEDVRIKVQLLSVNKFSASTNIRSDSHKEGNNTHEKQEETKSPADVKVTCVQSMNKQDESKSSAGKSVSNIPVVTLPEKGSCSSFDSANSGNSKTEVNCKLIKENNAKVGSEKYLSRKNTKGASEKNPLKKDRRGSLERSSEIKTRSANHGKSLIDTVSVELSESHIEKNKWYDHNEGSRENRRVNDGKKESENNEQSTTEKGENPVCDRQQSRRNGASECDKSRRKKDTWCNKNMVNRMPFKKPRENDGKTGFDKQHKRDGNSSGMSKNDRSYRESYDYYYTKSENYKGKKASYSKNEHINESCNQVLKSRTKLNSGYCQTNEKFENKEENPITVSELAAKVDELAVGKLASKRGSSRRKGKGWPDNSSEGKEDLHGSFMKGSMREEKSSETKLEPSDKALAGNEKESKCAVSNIATPEFSEKSPRVKSYSNVRENRKNRGNKSLNMGKIHSNHQEEIKIQVTINRNSHERTSSIRLRSESDTEEFESKSQNTQGVLRNRNKDDVPSLSQKHSSSMKSKSVGYGKAAQDINVPEFKDNPGEFDMEHDVDQMTFIDVPDDLIDEVDRDMSWCNQHVGGTKTPTWEDEKSTWKSRRDKHSENEDQQRRVESPGRRAGLIQLSTTVSGTDNSGSEPAVSHQLPAATQQLQKHLYNPHNPSKPVLVVPSARDLPVSRDPHREVGRGFGDSVTGSLLAENSNISEYAVEGRNPKIDPSLLYNIQKGEMDINYYVSSNQLPVEFRRIMDIRHHLQGCYKQLLTSDIRMCQEKNVEGCLWKTLYYVIIEKLREYISRDPTLKDRSLSTLLMLVDEGQRYLQDLLEALQREYGFTLEDHLEEEGTSHTEIRGKARIALMSAQKLLLSLGDLARYREQYSSTPNFNLAKKWYQMALQVHPRNGRPFNQLAIIAVNQKRPLDVVYYYIRSLTASNPFMSARDSLVSMFDDIRKKYISAQHNEPRTEGMQTNMGRAHHCEGLRQEIWIRPDSGATHRRTLSQSTDGEGKDEENELKKIPLEQLMKRFLTSYLHCHGMLFSRVGLDGFRECCVTMMQEFCVLLRSSPPRLSTNHLLQIMAINMYAVSNTELKGEC
nr:dentin sialophosphoprotein-like [Procambarus clarkii]